MNDIEAHYDYVSDAWQYMMGDNLHYGYFKSGKEDINTASRQLMDEMLVYLEQKPDMHILDVGCGTGGPAFYVYEKFNTKITGIALSPKEIAIANKQCREKNLNKDIQFIVADAMDNKLPSTRFDAILIMESSLLMPDKQKVFSECFRVLKPGGVLVLCDQIKVKGLKPSEMYRQGKKLEALLSTFGKTKTETLDFYAKLLNAAGFSAIETRDISLQALPTLKHWKENCLTNKNKLLEQISLEKLNDFVFSCDILQEFIENKILGYGIVKAKKE